MRVRSDVADLDYRSRANFRRPQRSSLRSGLNTRTTWRFRARWVQPCRAVQGRFDLLQEALNLIALFGTDVFLLQPRYKLLLLRATLQGLSSRAQSQRQLPVGTEMTLDESLKR
jgi:hypothetical protein